MDKKIDNSTLKITVSVITYRRPDHLLALLESFRHLRDVDRYELCFLVVDNDEQPSAEQVVKAVQDKDISDAITANRVWRYVWEPRKGIPVARNRGLDEALTMSSDLLCFVDDDEVVDRDWLSRLLAVLRSKPVHMVGGPVLVGPIVGKATRWQTFVHGSLAARSKRKADQTAKAATHGDKFTIVTNNWLADLAWLRKTAVRFDEQRFRYSGGSDTAFYRAFKTAGGKGAWSASAVVYETVMLDRLSLRYQLKRGRAQSSNHFRMKYMLTASKLSVGRAVSSGALAILRGFSGLALFFVPVFGLASPVMAVRSVGWALGRFDGIFGRSAALYDRPEVN